MKIIETPVYLYAELSEAAKERARDWWIGCMGAEDYAEPVIEDAEAIAELMGIKFKQRPYQTVGGKTRHEPAVSWSGFSSQDDGASFEGWYRPEAGALLKVKEYAPVDTKLHAIAQVLDEAFSVSGGRTKCNITTRGNYSHSGTMEFDFIEVDGEDDEAYASSAVEQAVTGALRDFADWIYRQLEKEYEYRCSEEAISEAMEANEYTFDSRGARFG